MPGSECRLSGCFHVTFFSLQDKRKTWLYMTCPFSGVFQGLPERKELEKQEQAWGLFGGGGTCALSAAEGH